MDFQRRFDQADGALAMTERASAESSKHQLGLFAEHGDR